MVTRGAREINGKVKLTTADSRVLRTWARSPTLGILFGWVARLYRSWFSSVISFHGLTFTWWGCCGLCLCLWHKQTELAHSFLFCSLYDPFNCIAFYEFSWQLCAFSLCSSGLISALLALSTMYLFMSLLQPRYIPLWLTGLKASTN